MTHTDIIQEFTQLSLDLRHYHWNSTMLAEHQALGEAYSSISSFTDTIAETLVAHEGILNPFSVTTKSCPVKDLPEDILSTASNLRKYSQDKYPDLVNLADEVTAVGSRLKYFYRLS